MDVPRYCAQQYFIKHDVILKTWKRRGAVHVHVEERYGQAGSLRHCDRAAAVSRLRRRFSAGRVKAGGAHFKYSF